MADPTRTAHLYTDAASGGLARRAYRLTVARGPDVGLERLLEEGTATLGTHPDTDLRLTDPAISRFHLELTVRADGLRVRDLDSTNGTFHGTSRVGTVTLTGPTRLRLGKRTELAIAPHDEAVPLAPYGDDRFGEVVGQAPVMRALFALLARVAPTEATLLLEGETGTGKEALAEAIHRASPRATGPFVVVDCGAMAHELVVAELFGHVRGAYTGADEDRAGLVEAADGGTLFLDEIGELALDLQPQLLRVLEKREVRRVGDARGRRVDVRVVAATHRDLRRMVADGTFREDLYFRLAVVRAVVPPLRERPDDVPLLVGHFAERMGRPDLTLAPALLAELRAHDWPGNVRELRNVVEQALSFGDVQLPGRGVGAAPPSPLGPDVLDLPFKEAKGQLVESFERQYLTHLLARHRGNISRAAQEAGIDRNYIHRLVKKYGIPVVRED